MQTEQQWQLVVLKFAHGVDSVMDGGVLVEGELLGCVDDAELVQQNAYHFVRCGVVIDVDEFRRS